MMADVRGLDRAAAPAAAKAKAMLDEIGGTWWNVYIGGPRASVVWTPAIVRDYKAQGITRFVLTYVGRQQNDTARLSDAQGRRDGDDACRLAGNFGFGRGTPLCLDLEGPTFDAARVASLDYATGWCAAVRAAGLRPGVYSNPRALIPLASRAQRPDWVWVAEWVRNSVDPGKDPHDTPSLSSGLWSGLGQRAWQYAGNTGDGPCVVGGLQVDINVADEACLAGSGVAGPTEAGVEVLRQIAHSEEDMFTFNADGKPTFFVAGGKAVGLNEASDLVAIRAGMGGQALPHFTLDPDTFEQFLRVYRS